MLAVDECGGAVTGPTFNDMNKITTVEDIEAVIRATLGDADDAITDFGVAVIPDDFTADSLDILEMASDLETKTGISADAIEAFIVAQPTARCTVETLTDYVIGQIGSGAQR